MSIKLLRIELKNIRSHSHVIFEPELEGITALQGPNGSGKSSIVDSIAWVLFGTKPSGVSKVSEIFKVGIGDKEKAYARIDVLVDGKPVRFERRRVNKQGSVECEVWSVDKNDKGEETLTQLAGPAISHAEPYIRKMLQMDEQGFLASILVQQKQVDQLISAAPRERGAVIEKLTGIAGITTALTDARQELNTLKKAVSFSTIDEQALEDLKSEAEELASEKVALETVVSTIKQLGNETRSKGEKLKAELVAATEVFEKKSEIEKKISDLEVRRNIKRELFEETSNSKDSEKKLLEGLAAVNVEEIESKLRELTSERDRLNLSLSRAEDKLISNKSRAESITREKKDLSPSLEPIETLEAERTKVSEAMRKFENAIADAKSQTSQIEQAISVIEHGDSCPTCLQTVADSAAATSALRSSIAALEEKVASDAKRLKKNAEKFEKLSQEIADTKRHADILEELSEIESENESLKKEVNSAKSDLLVVENTAKGVSKNYDEAKRLQDRRNSYKRLLEKAQSLNSEIETIEFDLLSLKKEGSALESASQSSLNRLQKKLDDTRAEHAKLSVDFTEKTGKLNVITQKSEFLQKEITRHEMDIAKHKQLLESISIASHTVDLVSEFRENRIVSSIPVIENYSSELLSRFTEGKFARLTLDQKFNATVHLSNGDSRSVGLLSGGELSAAAMSLRLAIAMLLNSGASQNMIVLDEVLVSQDAARAEQILTTIKELFQGQIVIIAHNETVDSVADKIVMLSPEEVA